MTSTDPGKDLAPFRVASTSVPRWSAQTLADTEFDLSARKYVIFAVGPEALAHVADHSAALPGCAVVVDAGGPHADAAVVDELATARVGWRFVVVGTGAAVMRLRALIVAAGAIDPEIEVVHLGGTDGFGSTDRDVFCSHCHTISPTTSGIDETAVCSGCGVDVVVYHHFSRRHAAYLGFRADSEELGGEAGTG